MTREKMMELWRKEFENSYYQWNLTPQVYEYLDGKTEELVGSGTLGKKYYAYYESWMVKELDGENAELARRMLVVISKIRSNGMIAGSYRIMEDIEICFRIGYDFDSLVKQSVARFSDIKLQDIYRIAEKLIEYHPAEAEQFADQLLVADKLEELISKRRNNRELYLALYLAVAWMKKNTIEYARYLPVIHAIPERIGGEVLFVILYYGYTLSPALKELLLKEITTNLSAARTLLSLTKAKEIQPFLKAIDSPLWPYYYLIAVEAITDVDKPVILRKLYKEDKDTFMELYRKLSGTTNTQDSIYSLYLLSILLQHGEGQPELEKCNVLLIASLKRLLKEYEMQKTDTLSELIDENIPLFKLSDALSCSRGFGWGIAGTVIGAFSVLYDYSSRAHRFMNLLWMKGDKNYHNYNNVSYTTCYFLNARKNWLEASPKESMQMLLHSESGYSVSDTFKAYCFANTYMGQAVSNLTEALSSELIEKNEQVALDMLTDGQLGIEETQVWLGMIYGVCGMQNYLPLIRLLSNKSKILRKKTEELINNNEAETRPLLEAQFSGLKGDALAAVKRIIKRWDNERKFGVDFAFTTNQTAIDFCTDNYDPGNAKYISWIPEDMYLDVRFADLSEKVPSVVLKYILSEYMCLEEPYKVKVCDKVVECLHPQDFQAALENIYCLWKDNGAEAKKKMIMLPYCVYASDSQIIRLKTQLRDWADASRGAIAAFVVNAIAMNGGSVALVMIDGMSVKFPNNQVKNAAKAAFSFAAKALEIPEDELSDKIVPTLDFNREGEKVVDYGSRAFKITLMPDFSLSIFDTEKQKEIKSMPAPGANDDTVKATAAKKEFSELKKQIKATVQSQTNRLEKVLMNGRRWTVSAWNILFVENPIMHRFATGLIWGVYEGDKLTATFRYMEDGTFNTVDEEECTLPEDAFITLIHPIELSAETLAQWKEQLDDYEIVQPLPQLSAPTLTLGENDLSGKTIVRYSERVVQSGQIAGMAKKQNLLRGYIGDGGSYTTFHWVDKFLNLAVVLNFEYMYMGQEYNDNVTLKDVLFYRLGEEQEIEDEPKGSVILEPNSVPARFISSVLGAFDGLKEE